jgi:hypothetical protein
MNSLNGYPTEFGITSVFVTPLIGNLRWRDTAIAITVT